MVATIGVLISTNFCENGTLSIEEDAIPEFTRAGFATDTYEATVMFKCLARYFDPDFMQMVLEFKDIGEAAIVWGTICCNVIKFFKKAHGYEKGVILKKDDKMSDIIIITEEMTPEELEKEIKKRM